MGSVTLFLATFLTVLAFGGIIALVCYHLYKHFTRSKQNYTPTLYNSTEATPEQIAPKAPIYKRKFLLTKHEWNFYNALKPIADRLGLTVLAKIRMADLVETVAKTNSDYYKGFAKVKAKHVDFALARPENLYIELLIELDDNTHTPGNERDAFVEKVYSEAGYKLLRIRNELALEESIKEALGIKIINGDETGNRV